MSIRGGSCERETRGSHLVRRHCAGASAPVRAYSHRHRDSSPQDEPAANSESVTASTIRRANQASYRVLNLAETRPAHNAVPRPIHNTRAESPTERRSKEL